MLTRSCAALLLAACLAACGDDERPATPATSAASATSSTSSPSPSEPATETPTVTQDPAPSSTPTGEDGGTRIVADDSEFGPMLFDATGQAIYLFDVETTSEPRCYDACAEAWPPVVTSGEPVAGPGVDVGLLGTTERSDGTRQVTYDGHPLYFYAHEGKGEVKCHDVFLNGGSWYVVQPGGDAAPAG